MKEIGKIMTVNEIEEMDIINLPFKYANDCLVYRVDNNKICFITNVFSNEPSVAEYHLKEDLNECRITFKGRVEKSTKNNFANIDDLDYGACFKFDTDSIDDISYMKTRQETVRDDDKVYTCINLANGDIAFLTSGTMVMTLEQVVIKQEEKNERN